MGCRSRWQTAEALEQLFGKVCLKFSLLGGFLPRLTGAGTLSPQCWYPAVPSVCSVMPLSQKHSAPEGLLLHGCGLSFSSKLCCAQQILNFLFCLHFPTLGSWQRVWSDRALWAAKGFTLNAGTVSANEDEHPAAAKTRGVTPESSLGAGPCSPWPNLAHGSATTSLLHG